MAAIRILPANVPLPEELRRELAEHSQCADAGLCLLFYQPGQPSAVLIAPSECLGKDPDSWPVRGARGCEPKVTAFRAGQGGWSGGLGRAFDRPAGRIGDQEARARLARAQTDLDSLKRNQVEIRPVARRQVFVAGKPVGEPFE